MASPTYSSRDLLAAQNPSSIDRPAKLLAAILSLPTLLVEIWADTRAMQADARRRYPHMSW